MIALLQFCKLFRFKMIALLNFCGNCTCKTIHWVPSRFVRYIVITF